MKRADRWVIFRSACLAAALLAAGCSAPVIPDQIDEHAADTPVWPSPPAQARVRYLRSVSGPDDLGIRRSMLGRLVDSLSGRAAEHFVRPTGVAAQDGIMYVADPGAHALWILDNGRNRFSKVTDAGDVALASPVAVAVRPDGAVFVADSVLKTVYRFTRDGKAAGVAAREGLDQPVAVAFDPAIERLFVADAAAHRISAFDLTGRLLAVAGAGGSEVSEFNRPTHLALDAAGTLLVTDALNFRVQAIDRTGRFTWSFGHQGDGSGDLAAPKGLAADSAGRIYVVDALFDAVQIFDRSGTFLMAFGAQGDAPGQFWLPNGLSIDAQQRIYIADSYNRRIQVFEILSVSGEVQRP
jgi:DNA-binding beta-propeller fold protein YncE